MRFRKLDSVNVNGRILIDKAKYHKHDTTGTDKEKVCWNRCNEEVLISYLRQAMKRQRLLFCSGNYSNL